MIGLEHVSYWEMAHFILDNSKPVMRVRNRLYNEVYEGLEAEHDLIFEEHGVTFDIFKYDNDKYDEAIDEKVDKYNYDVEIIENLTSLTDEEKQELYNTMCSIIVERDPEDERLLEMHFETFEAVYLKRRIEDYLRDRETEDFYKYVEDHIYETVCYDY